MELRTATDSRRESIVVRAPALSRMSDGRWRVGAEVDGAEVYLIADEPLVANGDAWASMMLLAAAKSGATLRVESDLDARLSANFGRIQPIARQHWGFNGADVVADRLVDRAKSGGGDAMFFTCGVDSFYALKACKDTIGRLIFVRGLNINLVDPKDSQRWKPARDGVAEVARELGIPASFPETNLRMHPIVSRVGWDISHVSAIAGVAHAMAPVISRIHVAGSEERLPYGSDPSLDPLWGSSAVELVNDGSEPSRLEKVKAIADWPLVHRNLSVCYESRGSEINCGVCMKCVGTQLRLEIIGARDRIQTFPKAPMHELIDAVPWLDSDRLTRWQHSILPHIRDTKIREAFMRLLERRPSAVDRLRGKALWLRKTAGGRFVRNAAKRLLIE
jgi:hypothetical protein